MSPGLVQPLIEALLATVPWTVHDWTISAFGWTIGVRELRLREFSSSEVYFGPVAFRTSLSATAVAIMTLVLVVVLSAGMAAIAAPTMRRT